MPATAAAIELSAHVGDRVRVLVSGEAPLEAQLFAVEHAAPALTGSSMFVFRSEAHHTFQKADYHLIPAARVSSFQVLARDVPSAFDPAADLRVPPEDEVQRRIASVVQQMTLERASRIGVDVSREAQFIFDSIVRTMPCRWDERNIIVTDAVVVRAPYEASDACVLLGAGVDAAAYADTRGRVLMLVKKAWERLRAGPTAADAQSPVIVRSASVTSAS